jgi:hypothetical protein
MTQVKIQLLKLMKELEAFAMLSEQGERSSKVTTRHIDLSLIV